MLHWHPTFSILLDPTTNHAIGSSAKVNILATLLLDFLVFYNFVTKPAQNIQNLLFSADSPHKMWRCHFNPHKMSLHSSHISKWIEEDSIYTLNEEAVTAFCIKDTTLFSKHFSSVINLKNEPQLVAVWPWLIHQFHTQFTMYAEVVFYMASMFKTLKGHFLMILTYLKILNFSYKNHFLLWILSFCYFLKNKIMHHNVFCMC